MARISKKKNTKIKNVLTSANGRGKSLRRSLAFSARPVVVVSAQQQSNITFLVVYRVGLFFFNIQTKVRVVVRGGVVGFYL